jgi:hypothetical protein
MKPIFKEVSFSKKILQICFFTFFSLAGIGVSLATFDDGLLPDGEKPILTQLIEKILVEPDISLSDGTVYTATELVDINDTTTPVASISNGNLGIGTTTIDEKLHIESSSDVATKIETTNATNGISELILKNTNIQWSIGNRGDLNDWFAIENKNDGNKLFLLTNNGRLHIGPTTGLEPNRNLVIGGVQSPSLGIESTTTTDVSQIYFGDADDSGNGRIIYDHSIDAMKIFTNGAETMSIDTSGNVGIGVIPHENWYENRTVLRWGDGALSGDRIQGANTSSYYSHNAYETNSVWKYRNTDEASVYKQNNGTHLFSVASSGGSDSDITWKDAMKIDSNGNVGIGIKDTDTIVSKFQIHNVPDGYGTIGFTDTLVNNDFGRGLTKAYGYIMPSTSDEIMDASGGGLEIGGLNDDSANTNPALTLYGSTTNTVAAVRIEGSRQKSGDGDQPLLADDILLEVRNSDTKVMEIKGDGDMIILGNGNVGIGVDAPNAKLDVAIPAITADQEIAAFNAPGSTGGNSYVTVGEGPGGYIGWDHGLNILSINSHAAGGAGSGITIKRIDDNSSTVGIGTQLEIADDSSNTVVNTPNGKLRMNDQSIIFGGPNNGKEKNSAQISVGLHGPDNFGTYALDIIGMSTDDKSNTRRVNIWAEGGMKVNGHLTVDGFTDNTSDKRLKKNIATIQNPLDKVEQLRGVDFIWKKDNKQDVGFIAQEVEKVFPQLVHTDEFTDLKSVQYLNIVAVLVEAIKEQQQIIESQNERLDRLEQ